MVAVIVDPNFGPKLTQIDANADLWICESSVNLVACEELRSKSEETASGRTITTFGFDKGSKPDQICVDILHDVALHHSWDVIEIYGVKLSDELKKDAIRSLESAFNEKIENLAFESTAFGIRIVRN